MYERDIEICEKYTGVLYTGDRNNLKEIQDYLIDNYNNAMYNAHIQMTDNYFDQL